MMGLVSFFFIENNCCINRNCLSTKKLIGLFLKPFHIFLILSKQDSIESFFARLKETRKEKKEEFFLLFHEK